MSKWTPRTLLLALLLVAAWPARAIDARFDLVGPKIDVKVTRGNDTLPIASVPNLQPGDKIWLHPDLPPTQSVKYLLICVFLRGTTNPPPDDWFTRIETWNKKVREEGVFVTVPADAQQAVLFLAPETGGDFSTLKSAVRGRPGVFVRATQDLAEAGFEQARIERYLADIRRVPSADSADLQHRSDLLARTLALKPNIDCFKRPVDQQFNCLTQTGSQVLLDDGHAQSIVSALSNGPGSDLITQASYTQLAGAGMYSAYVGAIVDLVRIMGNLHTAQYQYIPAIAFPQADALNLRLNTPPSFHNPKSVLVIGLPSVQPAQKPPLRPTDPNQVACLLKPSLVLQVDGAPLVFSTDFATGLKLHLNTPPGAPGQPDIPLVADAFEGGLVLQQGPQHHVPLHEDRQALAPTAPTGPAPANSTPKPPTRPEPVTLTGTVEGRWGFDSFTGPTLKLQQLPGGDWHIVSPDGSANDLIAGKTGQLYVASSGSACVHTISAEPPDSHDKISLNFQPDNNPDHSNLLAISLPGTHQISPGDLHLEIQQYGQPKPDLLAARAFADPPQIASVQLPAGDRFLLLTGTHLGSVDSLRLGDLVFRPEHADDTTSSTDASAPPNWLRLSLAPDAPSPPTHAGEHLTAQITLNDGRRLPLPLTVLNPRPSVTLLTRSFDPLPTPTISLTSPDDLPLSSHINFTLKTKQPFPRNGQVEVETLDGTLRAVLTLAPAGGLVLQDPHTVVAGLDPLRSFGPSAFGALRLRAVYPPRKPKHADEDPAPAERPVSDASAGPSTSTQPQPEDLLNTSDWLPLGTLVRLPVLAHLQCPADPAAPCNLTGSNLFLLQSISSDPAFSNPDPVPDGFTGQTLPVPHPAGSAATLFLKLRDDPNPVDSASLPAATVTTQASTGRHSGSSRN